jgi:hypothetical protein
VEVLGRACQPRRVPAQEVRGLVVVEPERVVADVVAAIAGQREERVAGARRAGDIALGRGRSGGGEGEDERSDEREACGTRWQTSVDVGEASEGSASGPGPAGRVARGAPARVDEGAVELQELRELGGRGGLEGGEGVGVDAGPRWHVRGRRRGRAGIAARRPDVARARVSPVALLLVAKQGALRAGATDTVPRVSRGDVRGSRSLGPGGGARRRDAQARGCRACPPPSVMLKLSLRPP